MPNLGLFKNKEDRNAWYREYRRDKADYFRKYSREHMKIWRKENGYASNEKWKRSNPEKVSAQNKAQWAKNSGKIILEPCEMCTSRKVVMHHDDYAKPLDVRFFCKIHHSVVHKMTK